MSLALNAGSQAVKENYNTYFNSVTVTACQCNSAYPELCYFGIYWFIYPLTPVFGLLTSSAAFPCVMLLRFWSHLDWSLLPLQKIFKEEELSKLTGIIRKMQVLVDMRVHIRNACDCGFLYWHRVSICIFVHHTPWSYLKYHMLEIQYL